MKKFALISIISVVALFFAGVAGLSSMAAKDALDSVNSDTSGDSSALTFSAESEGDEDTGAGGVYRPDMQREVENYLLVGVDSRSGDNANVGAGGTSIEGMRADTIMVAHVPNDKTRVSIISIPRDLSVERPECDVWDVDTGSYGSETLPGAKDVKINSTFAHGGPRCLVRTVTKLTGLKITHYAGVDFSGFESIVDTLGGVEVCTEIPLVDGELGEILDKPGKHTLTGEKALDYVRARKIPEEGGGDYSRIYRQQVFLTSLLDSVTKSASNPAKIASLAKQVISHSFGENITLSGMVSTATMLKDIDPDNVVFITVPALGTNDKGNETVDREELIRLMRAVIADDMKALQKTRETTPESSSEPETTQTPANDEPAPENAREDEVRNSLRDEGGVTASTRGACDV